MFKQMSITAATVMALTMGSTVALAQPGMECGLTPTGEFACVEKGNGLAVPMNGLMDGQLDNGDVMTAAMMLALMMAQQNGGGAPEPLGPAPLPPAVGGPGGFAPTPVVPGPVVPLGPGVLLPGS